MIGTLGITTFFALLPILIVSSTPENGNPPTATRNIVLVTIDGLRWQDVFRGADDSLIDAKMAEPELIRGKFCREDLAARREALMPFLWSTIAHQGQIYGNRDKESSVRVTNGKNFSYPGYNELLTGVVDPQIDSNKKRPNPNVSVLEWLHRKPTYQGKVAMVGSWDVHPFILNADRSGIPVNAGWMPIVLESPSRAERLLNDLMSRSIHEWEDCRNDVFTFRVAIDHIRQKRPHVFYMALGDTDEYGHAGRYDLYLHAAHEADAAIKTIWDELQSRSHYRGTTTLIVTTDHGRGGSKQDWRNHGAKVAGSDATWIAVLGPDTPGLGERTGTALLTSSQLAGTLAALLGEDYNAEVPQAGGPIWEVVSPRRAAPSFSPPVPEAGGVLIPPIREPAKP